MKLSSLIPWGRGGGGVAKRSVLPEKLGEFGTKLLTGIVPGGRGEPPRRDTEGFLLGFNEWPWLRATSEKIAFQTAATKWTAKGARSKQTGNFVKMHNLGQLREDRLKAMSAATGVDIEEFPDHPLIALLMEPCPALPGLASKMIWQEWLDIAGEAFFVIERTGPLPTALWPLPPHWVRSTPTAAQPYFDIQYRSLRMRMPMSEVLWDRILQPHNPYGRGSGLFMTLGDELAAHENASKLVNYQFYNRGRPDLLVTLPTFDEERLDAFKEKWRSELGGVAKSFKTFFANSDAKVLKLAQDFVHMQLVDLEKGMRDTIRQVPGIPPEILGITESSNRATIDAADFIMAKHVLTPRLEHRREFLQTHLVPMFDDRIVLEYESPVEEDKSFVLSAMSSPVVVSRVNEGRKLAGLPPLSPEEGGDLFVVTGNASLKEKLEPASPLPLGGPGLPGAPGTAPPFPPKKGDEEEPGKLPTKQEAAKDDEALEVEEGAGGQNPAEKGGRSDLRKLVADTFCLGSDDLAPDVRLAVERHLRLRAAGAALPDAVLLRVCGALIGKDLPELDVLFGPWDRRDDLVLDYYAGTALKARLYEPLLLKDRDYVRDKRGRFAETGSMGPTDLEEIESRLVAERSEGLDPRRYVPNPGEIGPLEPRIAASRMRGELIRVRARLRELNGERSARRAACEEAERQGQQQPAPAGPTPPIAPDGLFPGVDLVADSPEAKFGERYQSDRSKEAIRQQAKEVFGTDDPKTISAAAGALPGATVRVESRSSSGGVTVNISQKVAGSDGVLRTVQAVREFSPVPGGGFSVYNAYFRADPPGGGIGEQMFTKEVEQLSRMGATKLRVTAAGNPSDGVEAMRGNAGAYNGYYTWARFGYDAPISENNFARPDVATSSDPERVKIWEEKFLGSEGKTRLAAIQATVDEANRGTSADTYTRRREALRKYKEAEYERLGRPSSLAALRKVPGGLDFWKAFGNQFSGSFNLKPDSENMKVLKAYMAHRKSKSKAKGTKDWTGAFFKAAEALEPAAPKGDLFEQGPELLPEDEDALEMLANLVDEIPDEALTDEAVMQETLEAIFG